ncbi:MAG: NAD(P)/FAD-dependent oxidoreductase [Flavobacteriales bacterium]|nr:NAD(P)/FAD-dependent oxidoreductase [Flavobacteriales bacterium]
MKRSADNSKWPTVVVVGGGFAGLELVKGLENTPYNVLLLDKQNHHCFQPLLYQVATASLASDSIAHPFRRTVAPMANVSFRMAEVECVDPEKKELRTSIGIVQYDLLVLATGSTTNFFGNSDMQRQAMQLKSISQALDIRSDMLQEFEAALPLWNDNEKRRHLNFVIVGAGPTGVELAGALAEIKKTVVKREYTELDNALMRIILIDGLPRVLNSFTERSSKNAQRYLEELGVEVWLKTTVTGSDSQGITLSDGRTLETNTVIWAAGVRGVIIPGLEAALNTRANRFEVDGMNALKGDANIFVLGDCALMTSDAAYPNGHPQVATVAIQQAQLLVGNLKRKAKREKMTPFTYHHKGSMAVIGRGKAVVDIGAYSFGGFFAWLLWMFVHVMQLVGFRNRVMVLARWAWKFLSWKNTIRLIIRPYIR